MRSLRQGSLDGDGIRVNIWRAWVVATFVVLAAWNTAQAGYINQLEDRVTRLERTVNPQYNVPTGPG